MTSINTLSTIGTIISDNKLPEKDAIHVPVLACVAGVNLLPGQDVGLQGTPANPIGIVDPFLTTEVLYGQKFWIFVYPRTITSLTHNWSLPVHNKVVTAKEWLKEYALSIDTGFNALIEAARRWLANDELFCEGGKFEGISLDPQFWEYYEQYTNTRVQLSKKTQFFTCSC